MIAADFCRCLGDGTTIPIATIAWQLLAMDFAQFYSSDPTMYQGCIFNSGLRKRSTYYMCLYWYDVYIYFRIYQFLACSPALFASNIA
jgi:hypothetical protein